MSDTLVGDPEFSRRVLDVCAACEAIDGGAYAYVVSKARKALAAGHLRNLRDSLELVAIGLDVRHRSGDTSQRALEIEAVDLSETIRRALESR